MKLKTLSAVAGLGGALILSGTANATYLGLFVGNEGIQNVGGTLGLRQVWRIYAEFSEGTDRVNAWYGNAANPLTIENRNLLDTAAGTGFQNFGAPTALAPYSAGTARDWDTYATVGVRYGNEAPGGIDATSVSPQAPGFIVGTALNTNNMAIFVTPDDAQGRANWRVVGQDTATRVLLMQLVVNVGENVRGTINIDGQHSVIGIAGGLTNFSALNQTFNSIPAPGALALLGLAGLVGTRRRRN